MFITCSVDKVQRGDLELTNAPVNLMFCKSIQKLVDSEGFHSIRFVGCDVEWTYNDKETCDKDYWRVINAGVKAPEPTFKGFKMSYMGEPYRGISLLSKWRCTDEDLDECGLVGTVTEVYDDPGYNGDGSIVIMHENGIESEMKVRRFYTRYERVE